MGGKGGHTLGNDVRCIVLAGGINDQSGHVLPEHDTVYRTVVWVVAAHIDFGQPRAVVERVPIKVQQRGGNGNRS